MNAMCEELFAIVYVIITMANPIILLRTYDISYGPPELHIA